MVSKFQILVASASLVLQACLFSCLVEKSTPFLAIASARTKRTFHFKTSTVPCRRGDIRKIVFASNDDNFQEEDDEEGEHSNIPDSVGSGKENSPFVMPKAHSFGFHGRSAPSQRKAMGRSGTGSATVNVCTNCGSEFVKWVGRCPTCKEWNTVQECRVERSGISDSKARPTFRPRNDNGGIREESSRSSWLGDSFDGGAGSGPIRLTDIEGSDPRSPFTENRLLIPDNDEWNTVLGGGLMPGSLTLLGGDPGVGKSTLLLQVAASVAALSAPRPGVGMGPMGDLGTTGPVLYISGEETTRQIASRASRLGIRESELFLFCHTNADAIAETVVNAGLDRSDGTSIPPSLVVVDSIQTMSCDAGGDSSPGGVTQVKESVALFLRLAKITGVPVILIGHVTKTGDVAGPKTVEHMVDCVLYLEGDRGIGGNTNLRILRATKNRFGSTDEVGLYEMQTTLSSFGGKLVPVLDPSSLFLQTRMDTDDAEGCAVSLILEGSRSMAAEVQALVVSKAGFKFSGRRTVNGISISRLYLILAVLEKRCHLSFSSHDVYINVVGGMRLNSGASSSYDGNGYDLAVAIALVSSLTSIPIRSDTSFVGEVGLAGELRPVTALRKRVTEARRMGFSRVISSSSGNGRKKKRTRRGSYQSDVATDSVAEMELLQFDTLLEAINAGLVTPMPPPSKKKYRSKANQVKEDDFPPSFE